VRDVTFNRPAVPRDFVTTTTRGVWAGPASRRLARRAHRQGEGTRALRRLRNSFGAHLSPPSSAPLHSPHLRPSL